LLAWYDTQRRDLPWRRTSDPYQIWVAEVMLVQTQVDTAIPYYRRFMERFPDVDSLAAADLDDVLKAWEGLGYYARARNLRKAAAIIVSEYGGTLPRDEKSLRALPGIGRYVAAAIRAIAFDDPVLAVDGNVRRVLSRLHDLAHPSDATVRDLGAPLVAERPGDVNQALMDLGSTICTPRAPRCEACPIESACLARANGTAAERPGRRPAKRRPHYDIVVGVVWRGDEILIAKRPPEGLLGGLWEFPGGKQESGESLEAAVVREVVEEVGIEVEPVAKIAAVDHAYSHFEITLHAFHCRYSTGTPRPLGCQEVTWVRPEELDRYAFPAANRRVLQHLVTAAPDDEGKRRRREMHREIPRATFSLLAAVIFATGCGGGGPEPAETSTVRDSATLRVVENLRPAWAPEQAWRVASEPTLEIGVEEGDDPYELYRVLDALRLDDGRIVISNAGTGELRFFDHEGAHLWSAGRHGQGPGEFGEFSSMRVWAGPRGTIVATDNANARVNMFRANGEFLSSARIEPVPGSSPPNVLDGFGDGTWLAVRGSGALSGATGEILRGWRRYFRYNSDGRPADSLLEVQAPPRYVHNYGEVTHFPFIPLSAEAAVAAGRLWLYVGDGYTHQIERRRLDGTLNSYIRWPETDRRRSAEFYERYRQESLAESRDAAQRSLYTHYYGLDLPIPEYLPAYQRLLVDDEGYLWVENYRLPWETQPHWQTFDPDGRWLGTVETPEDLRPFQIGSDFLLGRGRDELGVERVLVYELIKP
jgi:A/G-specific adenine glycosylase